MIIVLSIEADKRQKGVLLSVTPTKGGAHRQEYTQSS